MVCQETVELADPSTRLGEIDVGGLLNFLDGGLGDHLAALVAGAQPTVPSDTLPSVRGARPKSPLHRSQQFSRHLTRPGSSGSSSDPPKVTSTPRRADADTRLGHKVSLIRIASPRHQQLRALFSSAQSAAVPSPPEPVPPVKGSPGPRRRAGASTSFSLSFASGLGKKPRWEAHPLLTAMESMHLDDDCSGRDLDEEQVVLHHRLEELRWSEQRKGGWTAAPAVKRFAPVDMSLHVPPLPAAGGRRGRKQPSAGDVQTAADMAQMIRLLDPKRIGHLKPDCFVPLMFWLGLTRKRNAALATLEIAFGPGEIEVDALRRLARYVDVQLRLVDGLKTLARLESLDQLCEFVTDWQRLNSWFSSMTSDNTGRVDIVEVQNLFARMEVTSDRQALYRFVCYFMGSRQPGAAQQQPDQPGPGASRKITAAGSASKSASAANTRTLNIRDFASMICTCAVTWCLHRALAAVKAVTPSDGVPVTTAGLPEADRERERETALQWTQLQRRIIVSLLVNHRFWGRESRAVLASHVPPPTDGEDLTPEQWLLLFQRVRAQGIASTLPGPNGLPRPHDN